MKFYSSGLTFELEDCNIGNLIDTSPRSTELENILIELRIIRASIPLTQGRVAREQIKELIDKLEAQKRRTK